jgi:peptidoglycan/xylan/chitin deacetylase (PgdA/CDA1 family)
VKNLYRPPALVRKIFNDFQWQTINNKILVSFDDGLTPNTTPIILNILNELNLTAIIFCVGENIYNYASLCKEVISEGHTIANHTYHHKKLTKLKYSDAIEEIKSVNNLAKENFNYEMKYFRPPHGKFNLSTNRLLKDLQLNNVMWNLLSGDYTGDINFVKTGIDKFLNSNSIIVFHDNVKSIHIIRDSINYLVESAQNKGFQFGAPEECLR